jgi:hypothetical protein
MGERLSVGKEILLGVMGKCLINISWYVYTAL